MCSALFSKKAGRLPLNAGLLLAGWLVLSAVPETAAGFDAPEPPPELGENLTGYRTRQQIIEQAIRAEESRNPPKMKIYRKDGTSEEYVDHNAVYGASAGTGSITVHEEPVKKVSQKAPDISVPAGGSRCCSRVIKDRFVYDSGKMFRLYDNSVLVFRIKDGAEVPWPISKAECSNNGFKIQLNRTHDSIRIVPSSVRINMANIKVYLQGRENSPLTFVVSMGSESRADMFEWDVLLSYRSPLNVSGEFHGVTNISKSAKARTTRRDVDNAAVQASVAPDDGAAPAEEGADAGKNAPVTGENAVAAEENINPDAGVSAYPINQKILYAVKVSEEELRGVADRLYEAVE